MAVYVVVVDANDQVVDIEQRETVPVRKSVKGIYRWASTAVKAVEQKTPIAPALRVIDKATYRLRISTSKSITEEKKAELIQKLGQVQPLDFLVEDAAESDRTPVADAGTLKPSRTVITRFVDP